MTAARSATPRRSTARRLIVPLVASFALLFGLVSPAHAADAIVGGEITGTVTADGSSGTKIQSVQVAAYRQLTFDGITRWSRVDVGFTDAQGKYSIAGLPADVYHLRFTHENPVEPTDPLYDAEFYSDAYTQETATAVTVTEGEVTSGKDASLGLRGTVTGTIAKAGGGAITNGEVTLYTYKDFDFGDDYWRFVTSVPTDAQGKYTFEDVVSGTYRIEFTDSTGDHVTEFYSNAATVETGSDVVVPPGVGTTTRDAQLDVAGSISGTVTGLHGAANRTCVVPYQVLTVNGETRDQRIDAPTSQSAVVNGAYTVKGLAAGTYKLEFDDCFGTGDFLARQYWDGSNTLSGAQPILVGAGAKVTGKDAVMALGATISGTVTGAGGYRPDDLASDRMVRAVDPVTGEVVGTGEVRPNGTYSVFGLAFGSYYVEFARESGVATFAAEFYNNIPEEQGRTSATPVTVAVGGEAPNIDATLVVGGHIKGRLVGVTGQPLADYEVHAYTDNGSLVTRAAYTEADGSFDIGGLTTGSYKIVANVEDRGTAGRGYYAGQTRLDASSSSATPVAVTIGGSRTLAGDLVLGAPPVVVGPPAPQPPAAQPPAIVKKNATIKVTGKGAKKKATLTITVKAPGIRPSGKITIRLGSKKLKTVTLKNGKAKIVLTKQKKGKRAYKVIYSGDSRVKAKTVNTKKITIT